VLVDARRYEEAARLRVPKGDHELSVMAAWLARKVGAAPRKTGFFARLFGGKARANVDRIAASMPEDCDADAFRALGLHGCTELPLPSDSTANLVRQLHQDADMKRGLETIELTVDGLEAPSGRLALVLELGCKSTDFSKVDYRVKAVQSPDPRRPRRPVRDVIWTYHGSEKLEVRQALPPPGKRVRHAVGELVTEPWFLPSWWERARALGPTLASSVDEILGAMVHPPRPPETIDAVEWVFRHQVASAFLLAHLDSGWSGSRRRDALLSLVDGVMDWTTDAAILALRELALDEPAALDEVEDRFWTMRKEVPQPGHTWFLEMLGCSYVSLPGTPAHRRATLLEPFKSDRK
jgi:hypothetical protein